MNRFEPIRRTSGVRRHLIRLASVVAYLGALPLAGVGVAVGLAVSGCGNDTAVYGDAGLADAAVDDARNRILVADASDAASAPDDDVQVVAKDILDATDILAATGATPLAPCWANAATFVLADHAYLIGPGNAMVPSPPMVERLSWTRFRFGFADAEARDQFPGAPGDVLLFPPAGCGDCEPGASACPATCVYGSFGVVQRTVEGDVGLVLDVTRVAPLQAFKTLEVEAVCRLNGPEFEPSWTILKGDVSNSVDIWLDKTFELADLVNESLKPKKSGGNLSANAKVDITLGLQAAGYTKVAVQWDATDGALKMAGDVELALEAKLGYELGIEGAFDKDLWKGTSHHIKTVYLAVAPWLYIDVGLSWAGRIGLETEGAVKLKGDLGTMKWQGRWGASLSKAGWFDDIQTMKVTPNSDLTVTGASKPEISGSASATLNGAVDLETRMGLYGSGGPFLFRVSPSIGVKAAAEAKAGFDGVGLQLCVVPVLGFSVGVGLELAAFATLIDDLTYGLLSLPLKDKSWEVLHIDDIEIKSASKCWGCDNPCNGACLDEPAACKPGQSDMCNGAGTKTCQPNCAWGLCSNAAPVDVCAGWSDGDYCSGDAAVTCASGVTTATKACIGCKQIAAAQVGCVGADNSVLHVCCAWQGTLADQPAINQGYGENCDGIYGAGKCHTGTDFQMACGTALFAPCAGVLTLTTGDGYGNSIAIACAAGGKVKLGHMQEFAAGLVSGATVSAGTPLGLSGNTGFVIGQSGCHLHEECFVGDKRVDCMANPAVVWHQTCGDLQSPGALTAAGGGAQASVCAGSDAMSAKPGWWCDGDKRVLCAKGVVQKIEPCPTGVCISAPLGKNDTCEAVLLSQEPPQPTQPPEPVKACPDAGCDDADPCTADSCSDAVCVHKPLSGKPCDDNDLCTAADTCTAGTCAGTPTNCDDANPCTQDLCGASGCTHPLSYGDAGGSAACDDDDPCTFGDTCLPGGMCQGTPMNCIASGVCASSVCVAGACQSKPTTGGSVCQDGSSCTYGDVCADGACAGKPVADTCNDANPCTADSCDPGSGTCAFTAAAPTPCEDGKACTLGDSCLGGTCRPGPSSCDDGKLCTVNTCTADGCSALTQQGKTCNDANPCTTSDICAATGDCAGKPTTCDDANSCTTDACNQATGACTHAAANGSCDDGNPCTIADACHNSACTGEGKACDDANPCTTDACAAGTCVHSAQSGACSDGDACSTGDTCVAGVCKGTATVHCDDGNPCTADSCAKGTCVAIAKDGAACDDGSACTSNDHCVTGQCQSQPKGCNDGNPCTTDWCEPSQGCQSKALLGSPCDDGSVCTTTDSCIAGACKGGTLQACADGNPCTTDACDPVSGCKHDPVTGAGCDDGNPCTAADKCAAGSCKGVGKVCDDGNVCTTDSCDLQSQACKFSVNSAPCNDGEGCSTNDVCNGGACVAGPTLGCDDGEACTKDACSGGKCTHGALSGIACNDGNPCTLDEQCSDGTCHAVKLKQCDDGNPCTADLCDLKGNCVHSAATGTCSDGNACTIGDSCAGGGCGPGPQAKCDDANPCTTDSCDSIKGCHHKAGNEGGACDDGLACTLGDVCAAGQCKPGLQSCDDGNPCTLDGCNVAGTCNHPWQPGKGCDDGSGCTTADQCGSSAAQGCAGTLDCDDGDDCTVDACVAATKACSHNAALATGKACDDGNVCTKADACGKAGCTGISLVSAGDCDDGKPCTKDDCSATAGGCTHSHWNGVACEDGDACSLGDTCAAGVCKPGAPLPCNDGDPCSTDSCDNKTGCKHSAASNTTPCDDGNACTSDDHCAGGGCVGGNPITCNGGGDCTMPTCQPWSGCGVKNKPNGTWCSDGDACTESDACSSGTCKGNTLSCEPKGQCWTAKCSKTTGCEQGYASSGTGCTVNGGNGSCNGSGACLPSCQAICATKCGQQSGCNCGTCEIFVDSTSATLYTGSNQVSTVGSCSAFQGSGWKTGVTQNGINVRWTWATTCIAIANKLYAYVMESARYPIWVTKPGWYKFEVKIPPTPYVCSINGKSQSVRYADGVEYGLDRAGDTPMILGPINPSAAIGKWVTLTSSVYLGVGSHTLILYDHGTGSTGCSGVNNVTKMVFADSIRLTLQN